MHEAFEPLYRKYTVRVAQKYGLSEPKSLPAKYLAELCDHFQLQLLVLTANFKYLKMYNDVVEGTADVFDSKKNVQY